MKVKSLHIDAKTKVELYKDIEFIPTDDAAPPVAVDKIGELNEKIGKIITKIGGIE